MGDRAECPVCAGYTSGIYSALHYKYTACPYCEAPHEVLVKWNNLKEELEELQAKRVSKDILNQLKDCTRENLNLQAKLERISNILIYQQDVLEPFKKVINILQNTEENDDN